MIRGLSGLDQPGSLGLLTRRSAPEHGLGSAIHRSASLYRPQGVRRSTIGLHFPALALADKIFLRACPDRSLCPAAAPQGRSKAYCGSGEPMHGPNGGVADSREPLHGRVQSCGQADIDLVPWIGASFGWQKGRGFLGRVKSATAVAEPGCASP